MKLIRVTQVGRKDIDNGKPTPLFIDPELIAFVHRQVIEHRDPAGKPTGETAQCTVVSLKIGVNCFVLEHPEDVAALRDNT